MVSRAEEVPRKALLKFRFDGIVPVLPEMGMTREKALRVAIGGFGAIGAVVARRLDRGVDGLTLVAVSARDTARAAGLSARLSP